jgi:hypothetical protein
MSEIGEKFLAKARAWKPTYEPMDVPGIGTVHIKRLDAGERDRYEWASKKYDSNTSRSLVLVHFLFDGERGSRLFRDEDCADLDHLDPAMIDPVVARALTFNGYTEAEREELVKNLNGQPANLS